MSGVSGHLGVQLPHSVRIMNISVGHIPPSLVDRCHAAPCSMTLWGILDNSDAIADTRGMSNNLEWSTMDPPVCSEHPHAILLLLAQFEYDIHSSHYLQTFQVMSQFRDLRFQQVVLQVLNNWGADDFTCLYRFRVHGEL